MLERVEEFYSVNEKTRQEWDIRVLNAGSEDLPEISEVTNKNIKKLTN